MTKIDDYTKKGFKEIKDDETYDIHEWSGGDILAGLLIGKKEINTKEGVSVLYSVEVDKLLVKEFGAERISFWGTYILDTRLKNVEVGAEEVVIEYNGKKKSSTGGRSYHDFVVLHKPIEQDPDLDEEIGELENE